MHSIPNTKSSILPLLEKYWTRCVARGSYANELAID
jgi:hypothetical protein